MLLLHIIFGYTFGWNETLCEIEGLKIAREKIWTGVSSLIYF